MCVPAHVCVVVVVIMLMVMRVYVDMHVSVSMSLWGVRVLSISNVSKCLCACFRLAERIGFLHQTKHQPLNTSQRRLVAMTSLAKDYICTFDKTREWASRRMNTVSRRTRNYSKTKAWRQDGDVDEALDEWFAIVTGRCVRVSDLVLNCKAEDFSRKLSYERLVVSMED